jgi:glycosyltransferase involved in cell wall biosynthesis
MKNPEVQHLVIVDPSYSESRQGHYNFYDEGIAEEARHSCEVHLFGAKSEQFSYELFLTEEGRRGIPVFSLDIWGQSNLGSKDLGLRSGQSKVIMLADFELAMEKLNFLKPPVFFFPNFTETQLGIISKLNMKYRGFEAILILRYQSEISPITDLVILNQQYIQNGNFLTVVTDSKELSEHINTLSEGLIKSILPVPHGMRFIEREDFRSRNKTRFIHLGNPRIEKGFKEIVTAIFDNNAVSDHEFVIQVSNPERELTSVIQELIEGGRSNVEIVSEFLRKEDYSNLLRESDCTLAPYSPEVYAHRTSSVIVESQALAVPVIATAGTVGGNLVQESGAGIVISELTPHRIRDAINEVSKRRLELTLRAILQRSAVFNSGTFTQLWVDVMASSNLLRRKKTVIFYPWSFQDVRYSGAGNRLLTTIRNLHKLGIEVTVFNGLGIRHRRYLDVDFIPLQLNIDMQQDSNLALHKSHIELANNLELQKHLQDADFVVFEGTHLVKCLEGALEEYKLHDAYVISHDLINSLSHQNTNELFHLQKLALMKYESFSLSKDEIKLWFGEGISVGFTKPTDPEVAAINPDFSDSSLESLISHVVDKKDKVLLFVGGSYWPNIEAVEFAKDFIEVLREAYPDFKLLIIGSVCEIGYSDSWVAVGKVSHELLDALYERASVCFIPMFHGTGVSIKTIEAVKKKKPVFTTVIGVRGLSPEEKSSCYVTNATVNDLREMVEEFTQAYDKNLFPPVADTKDESDSFIYSMSEKFSSFHRIIPSLISTIQDLSRTQISHADIASIIPRVRGNKFELQTKYLLAFYTYKSGIFTKSSALDLLSDGELSKSGRKIPVGFLEKDTQRLVLGSSHFDLLKDSEQYIDDEDLDAWYNFTNQFTQQFVYYPVESQNRIFTLYSLALRIQKYWIVRRVLSSQLFLNSRIMKTYRTWKHRPLKIPMRPW